MKIGFVVNPIAGMGGAVGLKGTDGERTLEEALARGAIRRSPPTAVRALLRLRGMTRLEFVTSSGQMGKDELDAAGFESIVVHRHSDHSTSRDTTEAAAAFVEEGVELIVFAGGDGTARDLLDAIDRKVPIVGIPTGVKMHSAVFANSADELADLVDGFSRSRATRDADVMDIDEDSFRDGVLRARLYGMAKVPDDSVHIQAGKAEYGSGGAAEEALEIGQYVVDEMMEGVAYIVGPGSTTAVIGEILGEEKTLLGVDVFVGKKLVVRDASEKDLLDFTEGGRRAVIVVTPVGAQGFFLGRGNQQISSRVVTRVGKQNILVIATPTKLKHTPVLRVDTGDQTLDASLRGSIRVVTGYKRRRLVEVH